MWSKLRKILLISISITLLLEVQHFPHQFTTDRSEELINTFTLAHFSKEAWVAVRRGTCVWENFADLALVEVINDGVVERLFELPLGL